MADPQYDTYLGYENLLMWRINDLDHALNSGGDGMRQYSILWSRLKKDIREPIQTQLDDITREAEAEIAEIKRTIYSHPERLGYPNNMSRAHRDQVINSMAKPINSLATLQMSQIVIDRLEDMNLLLRTRRNVPTGTLPRLKDEEKP